MDIGSKLQRESKVQDGDHLDNDKGPTPLCLPRNELPAVFRKIKLLGVGELAVQIVDGR